MGAFAVTSAAAAERAAVSLEARTFYTDNFYYQTDDAEAVSGLLLQPALVFNTESARVGLSLLGMGEYGSFSSPGEQDDYFDSRGAMRLAWSPTYRTRFLFDGGFRHGHDPFGIQRTEGAPTTDIELDEWDEVTWGARYRYGAPSARVNADLGFSGLDRRYTTNEAATAVLDYASTTVDYNLTYNYSPKTAAVISFSRSDVEFDQPFDNDGTAGSSAGDVDDRSGIIYQIRTGVRWLATAKTSGDVRAGYRRRQFDNVDTDLEGSDWQAGIQWSPTAPLLVELRTGRSEQQSYLQDAQVIDVKMHSLKLTRTLTSRTKGQLSLERSEAGFFGSNRDDESNSAEAGLEYHALRHLYFTMNLGYETRESTAAEREYERFTGYLGFRLGRR